MQSLLQYRRIGDAAQAQINQEKNSDQSPSSLESAEENVASHGAGNVERTLTNGAAHARRSNENGVDLATASTNITRSRTRDGEQVYVLGWAGPNDPLKPHNWPLTKRIGVVIQISLIGLFLTGASGIDAVVLPQAAKELGVSPVAESLATGLYLAGMGLGSLVAGPFSETFGRTIVYVVSIAVFMIWIMASALAPNYGAQITFRLLAGFFASTPLVCAGGSIADMFNSAEKTWSFPLYAIISFSGPMLGAVIGAYIGPSKVVSWRWAEWTMLIASGLVLVIVVIFMPETYEPLLLQWKARHYRRITGDSQYRSEHEIGDATLLSRLGISMTRPFLMLTEPIIILMTLYITVIYIVLFTFLIGWPYIFEYTYGINQGLSHIIFIAMLIGTELNFLLVPIIYRMTMKRMRADTESPFRPEIRLWYGTFGSAILIPISLFWLGWTNYASISIWSAILAVTLFGYGVVGIFLCVYMYIIDCYEMYSASALTFVALTRYVVAGGMTAAGIPFYEDMGTHWTLTILGGISTVLVPIPYVLYYYGPKIRAKSKFAVL